MRTMSPRPSKKTLRTALASSAFFLFFSSFLFLTGCPRAATKGTTAPAKGGGDESQEQAFDSLTKSTDLLTVRSALQQLAVDLHNHPERQAAPLTEERRRSFENKQLFGLDDSEFKEIEHPNFTGLDAHYLELAFLMRDAVRAAELNEGTPAEQAAASFAWVVRQVRLREATGNPMPPQLALRLGRGSALERSLVFVALLDQLGVTRKLGEAAHKDDLFGCLVGYPGGDGQPVFWACGAVVQDGASRQVLLFDPRLGLALPGPGGQGVATWAALQAKPDLLQQLTSDDKVRYDVTPEQVRASALYLAPSLSALAPRLLALPEQLHAGGIDVGVPDPVEALTVLREATRLPDGKQQPVEVWRPALRVQRQFWPAEEGGTDNSQPPQAQRRLMELVPMQLLPPFIKQLGEPGQRLTQYFAKQFIELPLDPRMPREMVLRGRYQEAVVELVKTRDRLREQKARLENTPDLEERLRNWNENIIEAQANLVRAEEKFTRSGGKDAEAKQTMEEARAKVELVMRQGQEALAILLDGLAAQARSVDVTYLLALAMHEQADRLQRRLDRLQQAGKPLPDDEVKAAREAWIDAGSWWDSHAAEAPPASVAAVRVLRAQAREAQGDRAGAVALLKDLSGNLTPLEQAAQLFLARRLEAPSTTPK
jgi:hypothetical protein